MVELAQGVLRSPALFVYVALLHSGTVFSLGEPGSPPELSLVLEVNHIVRRLMQKLQNQSGSVQNRLENV